MLTRVEGIYRNGRIELTQLPANVPEETRAIGSSGFRVLIFVMN
jgi:hypothetical protein